MTSKTTYKAAGFILLLAVYFLAAGSDITLRLVWRMMLLYVTGAAMAFWAGADEIGTFRRINMRPICILIGALFMIWAFAMTLSVREARQKGDRQPNHPAVGQAGMTRRLTIGPYWPGCLSRVVKPYYP
jgi:hypothetical protein